MSVNYLKNFLNNNHKKIKEWFEYKNNNLDSIFYSSVDIRKSDYKIAPIDTNLFPAGFNNFSDKSKKEASEQIKKNINQDSDFLIVPENHSRNLKYFENLKAIQDILSIYNKNVSINSLTRENTREIELSDHSIIKINSLEDLNKKDIYKKIFLLNNDLINGNIDFLEENKKDINIYPDLKMGWFTRTKYIHFTAYNSVISDFCSEFQIDPFFISCITKQFSEFDINNIDSLTKLAEEIELLKKEIKDKNQEHGIKEEPYIFIKANQGSYGIGVIKIKYAQEVLTLNKKNRNKMKKTKGGNVIKSVIIQEGIKTSEYINNYSAESIIYSIFNKPITCLKRFNKEKDNLSSLNTKNSYILDHGLKNNEEHSFIANLANLAASIEIKFHNHSN